MNSGSLEDCLRTLVNDVYVSFLLPQRPPAIGSAATDPGGICFRHPIFTKLNSFIMQDPDLRKLFPDDSAASGPSGYTLRTTGMGGSINLWTFAEELISAGLKLTRIEQSQLSPDLVANNSIRCVDMIRRAIRGERVRTPITVGLTGVLLPDGQPTINLGWARIRPAEKLDVHFPPDIPRSTPDSLGLLTDDGPTAVIHYSGDVIAEFDVEYTISLGISSQDFLRMTPGFSLQKSITEAIENIRLGLLLAVPETPVPVILSWQYIFDPLSAANGLSWNDTEHAPRLHPRQLSLTEAADWGLWAGLVHDHRTPAVAVSVRRVLRAVAERVDPEDALIDAVIVWENLLEPDHNNLPITEPLARALALLLEPRHNRSSEVEYNKSRFKKLYNLRSRVLHGDSPAKPEALFAGADDALTVSIYALRTVFDHDSDLLRNKKSADRCAKVLAREIAD